MGASSWHLDKCPCHHSVPSTHTTWGPITICRKDEGMSTAPILKEGGSWHPHGRNAMGWCIAVRNVMSKLPMRRRGYFHTAVPARQGGRLPLGRIGKGSSDLMTSSNGLPSKARLNPNSYSSTHAILGTAVRTGTQS